MGRYKFGKRSLRELIGVHPYLGFMSFQMIEISEVDFGVFDGLRTKEEQYKLYHKGYSKTLKSYHLWGLAVDLVPYINGRYTWSDKEAFDYLHDIANNIIKEHSLPIESPFKWDRAHWQMTGYKKEYDARKFIYPP